MDQKRNRILTALEWSDTHNPHPFVWGAVAVLAPLAIFAALIIAGYSR
jgi:hypothetical protein